LPTKIKRKERRKKMNRISIMVAILLSLVMISAIAEAQSISQVLMIPREGKSANLDLMLSKQVGVMTELLQKAGFKVVVASVSGEHLQGVAYELKPDLKLTEVKLDDYAGVIIPCMATGLFPGPPISPVLVSIVKQAVAKGKPVATGLGGAYILAEAGVLKGKRYAFVEDALNPVPPHQKDPRFEGAIYSGSGLVQDGNIITSGRCPNLEAKTGLPDNTPELTRAFIAELRRKK
jgi:putative intracellular protease/amidase